MIETLIRDKTSGRFLGFFFSMIKLNPNSIKCFKTFRFDIKMKSVVRLCDANRSSMIDKIIENDSTLWFTFNLTLLDVKTINLVL